MTDRVTMKILERLVDQLNELTDNPTQIWTRDNNGHNRAHVGAYVLDAAYGGYKLSQIVSNSGGERDITGRDTAGNTARLIRAYMAGLKLVRL